MAQRKLSAVKKSGRLLPVPFSHTFSSHTFGRQGVITIIMETGKPHQMWHTNSVYGTKDRRMCVSTRHGRAHGVLGNERMGVRCLNERCGGD